VEWEGEKGRERGEEKGRLTHRDESLLTKILNTPLILPHVYVISVTN